MEIQNIKENIRVFYIEAESFPAGIAAAHEKLHTLLSPASSRRFFGISYPEKGSITYKAAVEEAYPGEGKSLGCETFDIRKGKYLSKTLSGWKDDTSVIGRTFQTMLNDPRLDKNGYCLEMYPNENEIVCMVRIES